MPWPDGGEWPAYELTPMRVVNGGCVVGVFKCFCVFVFVQVGRFSSS